MSAFTLTGGLAAAMLAESAAVGVGFYYCLVVAAWFSPDGAALRRAIAAPSSSPEEPASTPA